MILVVRDSLRLMSCLKETENTSEVLFETSIINDYIDVMLASRATREKLATEVSYFGDLKIP